MKHLLIVTSLGATLLASLNASPVRAQEAAIGVSVSAPLTPVTLGAAAVVMIIANEAFARHPFGPDGEIMKILAVPVKIVDGNVKAAAGERGEIAKVLRGASGISVRDIEKYGIFGGPNSVFRKPLG